VTEPTYPFPALVGQADLRLALLLNAVQPAVGGVLVRGEKGTAKSTAVRALAALLPPVEVAEGCRFGCDPDTAGCPDAPHRGARVRRPARLVELPVGATEDRLVGSLDLERALSQGEHAYQPGLLARAHRGMLYVDEVNLLPDHLVDLLLDAAAMGRAHVERDGVSVSHAASFVLVGTMNPEEGELRPQLLDRFGLTVEVRAARAVDERVEVVRRRLAFEDDPAAFHTRWAEQERELRERIARARSRLAGVRLADGELRRVAAVCAAFDVDGMRADLVIARAAVAHAAWRGADAVEEQDVRAAARLALPHRRRRDPFDEPGLDEQALDDALREGAPGPDRDPDPCPGAPPPDGAGPDGAGPDGAGPDGGGSDGGGSDGAGPDGAGSDGAGPDGSTAAGVGGSVGQEPATGAARGDGPARPAPAVGAPFRARRLEVPGLGEGAPGRRSRARTDTGRVVRATAGAPGRVADLHLFATVAAAARRRSRAVTGPGLDVRPQDLRGIHREGREGNLVLFAVDASGSMAARERMSAVTGAVLSLLRDAYRRRDRVGLVTFRAVGGEVVLPPTASVPAARARLADLRTGGRTPLADGLLCARRVLAVEALRDPRRRPLLVLLTDGRATLGLGGDPVDDACRAARLLAADGIATVVVDCERGPVRLGLAGRLAVAAGAAMVTLEELSADRVAGVVRAVAPGGRATAVAPGGRPAA